MIYRPSGSRYLWDTWLFPWDNNFHLFFLESVAPMGECDKIGHAVSSDLVNWSELPSIPVLNGAENRWDFRPTLTGTVVRNGGEFWMFYGATGQRVQRIGVMHSSDLLTWKPYDSNPVLTPQAPYMAMPDQHGNRVPWRDPCISWRNDWGAYEALVCAATAESGENNSGACIARCRSADLLHWEALSPAAAVGTRFIEAEVPDYFELGGLHYILFSSQDGFGAPLSFPSRERTTGVYYMVAEERDGPYRLPEDPLLLGAGRNRKDAYVGRTIQLQGDRLIYHHHYGARPAWGAPKLVRADSEGRLHLDYWPGFETLHRNALGLGSASELECQTELGSGDWQATGTGRFVGHSGMRDTPVFLKAISSNFHLTGTLEASEGSRTSIIFRRVQHARDESKRGVVVTLDLARNKAEWGTLGFSDINMVKDNVPRPLKSPFRCRLRLIARDEYFEFYLDDECVFSACVGDAPPEGNLGFSIQGGKAIISDLKIFALTSLD